MRLGINLLLLLLVAGLIYVLISSIQEPIKFKAEKEMRESAVIDRLVKIRQAQECFRDITGQFAHNFDTLSEVLNTGQFKIVQVFGDPDDPTNTEKIRYDTIFKSAKDSIAVLGIDLEAVKYVPFSDNVMFDMKADTITYQKTLVNVCEVGTQNRNYMGAFADARFTRYDNSYDPDGIIKFGNMGAPNLSGNWER